jgi:hypothetical protein
MIIKVKLSLYRHAGAKGERTIIPGIADLRAEI